MHNDMKLMGRVVRRARETQALTQAALAEKIDASIRSIIAIENGQRNPTVDTLFRLVHALDIPTDLIFRPDAVPNTPEQEQFISEFLSRSDLEQRVAMTAARCIWREFGGGE
ncbi:hypothetical protein FACS189492_0670 [Clostridia bacterium]|nr:hypothetical protein FACS189492_0670 [Clostridia bacterium]